MHSLMMYGTCAPWGPAWMTPGWIVKWPGAKRSWRLVTPHSSSRARSASKIRMPLSIALTASSAPAPPARNVCPRMDAWPALPSTVTENQKIPGVTGTMASGAGGELGSDTIAASAV